MKDRILKLITVEQMTSAKFADVIGVQRSSISHILSGRNNPSLDFIQKILTAFPNISPEWLILGKGKIYKKDVTTELFNDTSPPKTPIVNKVEQPQLNLQIETPSLPITKMDTEKVVERIVVFYSDKTFREYLPE